MIKIAAFALEEILEEHDIKYGYHAVEKCRCGEKKQIWKSSVVYYNRMIPMLRKVLEYLADKNLYTRTWKSAKVFILFSPFCSCCDSGSNAAKAIDTIRAAGFDGKIIVVFPLDSLDSLDSLDKNQGGLPYYIRKYNGLIGVNLLSETCFSDITGLF